MPDSKIANLNLLSSGKGGEGQSLVCALSPAKPEQASCSAAGTQLACTRGKVSPIFMSMPGKKSNTSKHLSYTHCYIIL